MTLKLGKKSWSGTMGQYQAPIYQRIKGKWCCLGSIYLLSSISHPFRKGFNRSPVEIGTIYKKIRKGFKSK